MPVAPPKVDPTSVLVELCESMARGDYDRANSLFELAGSDAAPAVARLAEAFGMMLVRVEAREMHLNQVIEELRESKRQLEDARLIHEWNRRLRSEVAERKRVEKQLRQSQRELEAARARAEEASRAKAAFLATMSHEIRTPMNGVVTMAGILDQTELTSEQREMARTIRQSSAALLTVVNDILDFSKVEAGKLAIEAVGFDPLELLEGVLDVLAPQADEKGLALVSELPGPLPGRVVGDPARLRQILLNLGGNAVKFTPAGSVRLRVSGETPAAGGNRLVLEVIDTGIGMSPGQVDGLFQPFSQAESSIARRFGGTGLGLAISSRLVELMGGSLAVESMPGRGSVFRAILPFPVAEAAPVRPAHDLGSATVVVAGFRPEEAAGLSDLLALGGVARPTVVDAPESWPGGGRPDLLVVSARGGRPDLAAWRRALGGTDATAPLSVLVTASHADLVGLSADPPAAPGVDLLGLLPAPVRARSLWDQVAVAIGLRPRSAAGAAQGPATTYAAPSLDEAAARRAAVLVADDNPMNRLVAGMLLSRMGIAHVLAEDGQSALGRLDEGDFGLLLCDVHMPVMDGIELTRRIRGRDAPGAARVGIVALSADVAPETAERCIAAGMDGYIRKPIEIEQLEAVLRHHVPAAFELRRERRAGGALRPGGDAWEAARAAVDLDVFDPDALNDAFGGFTTAALALATGVCRSTEADVEAIDAALRIGDTATVRSRTHSAAGALLSIGARRLARLMRDLRAAVDSGDAAGAEIYRDGLTESCRELDAAIRAFAPAAVDTVAG